MSTRRELANAIRFLSIDAVQKAKSGHPGMPMGMADIAEVLWNEFLQHNPQNPNWINRDRFVLSNGHGSMLLYSVLHLTGYAITIDDLKKFRQINSITPGHPEFGITPGVDATTGPLGQGLACAVGMALAQVLLANKFNQPNYEIINHYTYCFVGDGCLMEGISHEVASFAGTLGLNKLIVFWDDNGISIDGEVTNWCKDDTVQRFLAYGWHVINGVDGHDPDAIIAAIKDARMQNKPVMICCKTQIGHGAPNVIGSAKAHGSPLGDDEVALTREQLAWHYPQFEIPEEIYQAWNAVEFGAKVENKWQKLYLEYKNEYPALGEEFERRIKHKLPNQLNNEFIDLLKNMQLTKDLMATRKASQLVLDNISNYLPELLGGSADLSESNATTHKNMLSILPQHLHGNYIHYGVREFGMCAIMNGIALHGGFIPYGGTFLTFIDYARNALRMSAMMCIQVIYILTHDSIGLGEDGPTHQPIEHLTMLRVTPNVYVWRPCDAVETVVAWQQAITRMDGPTCLALSRQNLRACWRSEQMLEMIKFGGYILQDCANFPDAIIIATGSEVELALQAADQLAQHGLNIRVVSIPCAELFLLQSKTYRSSVIPETVQARVVVEAGASAYWYQFVGQQGKVIGIDSYGESAPYKDIYVAKGLTVATIVDTVQQALIIDGDE